GNRRALEALIQALGLRDRVLRLGRLDVAEFFSGLDVLALPYRLTIGQNAFPNLVLEAMEVGVPLVTSDLPLLRELLADRGAAVLVEPGQPTPLAEALGRLLDEPALATRLVAAQRQLMSEELDATVLARRYSALYQEVLAEQTP